MYDGRMVIIDITAIITEIKFICYLMHEKSSVNRTHYNDTSL
jgi:hypothetical protein